MEPDVRLTSHVTSDAVRRRARLVLLGCSAWLWLLAIALPAVDVGVGGVAGLTWALSFPAAVVAAMIVDELAREARMRRLAEGLLLVAVPLTVVGSLASRPELARREVLGPVHLSLVVLACASYLAAAAWLSSTHVPRRATQAHPLPPSARLAEPAWPRAIRASLVVLVSVGAVGLLAVAPVWSGLSSRLARHGAEAAETAALLAGVVGMALGVTILGAVVGPALRARSSADRIPRRGRGLVGIALAVICVATWLWLQSAG